MTKIEFYEIAGGETISDEYVLNRLHINRYSKVISISSGYCEAHDGSFNDYHYEDEEEDIGFRVVED